jgi:uncharacterized protein DUF4153
MDRASSAARVLAAALGIGLLTELLIRGHAVGVNLVLVTGALLAAVAVLRPRDRRLDPLDAWLPFGALLFAAFPALRTDEPLIVVDTLVVIVLVGATVAAATGAPVTRQTLLAGLELAARVTMSATAGAAPALAEIAGGWEPGASAKRQASRLAPVARGLFLGLPLLILFAALFTSADPIFARWLDSALNPDVDISALAERAAYTGVVAWIAAGLLWFVSSGQIPMEARSLGAAARSATLSWPRLGAVEAVTVLVTLDLLFGAFVALQLAYLFGGLDTLAASGLTYANYARRGFFELLAVGFLSGAIIGSLEATVRERARAYVVALLGLIALTGVVLVSSFVRLRIYQEAYGWTELRFWVFASILFLALAFAAAAVLVVRGWSRWLPHAVAAAGVVVLVGINAVGPQAFVTDRNLERALDPTLIPADGQAALDTLYLGRLDADAVQALVAALPTMAEPARTDLLRSLQSFRIDLDADAARGDWPAWNLSRERARAALESLFGR